MCYLIYILNILLIQNLESKKSHIEWSEDFVCDHVGVYSDHRNSTLSPAKKRHQDSSIKIGCGAKVIVKKPVNSKHLEVKYYWTHTNHGEFW